MLVKIANRKDYDQTASSDLILHCLSRPFLQATGVQNFTIYMYNTFDTCKSFIESDHTVKLRPLVKSVNHNFYLFLNQNIFCGCSKEPSQ